MTDDLPTAEQAQGVAYMLRNRYSRQNANDLSLFEGAEQICRAYSDLRDELEAARYAASEYAETCQDLQSENARLRDGLDNFCEEILHGDDEHREWLREAFDAYKSGDSIPPPRGSGRKTVRND